MVLEPGHFRAGLRKRKLDARGYVDEDIECSGCGYNLRGLSPAAVCPECGIPVIHSAEGHDLEHAEPAHLRRLAVGAHLIGVSCVLAWVGYTWLVLEYLSTCIVPPQLMTGREAFLFAVVWSPAAIGCWLATTIRVAEAPLEQAWSLRRCIRFALFMVCLSEWVRLMVVLAGLPFPAWADVIRGIMDVALIVMLPRYLSHLAARLGDDELHVRMIWLTYPAVLVVVWAKLQFPWSSWPLFFTAGIVFRGLYLALMLGVVVTPILAANVAFRCGRELWASAEYSRKTLDRDMKFRRNRT